MDSPAVVLYNSTNLAALTASGNSGSIDVRYVDDLALTVVVGGAPTGTSPTLVVQIDMLDAAGNWLTQVAKTANINAAGQTLLYAGKRGASAGAYLVLTATIRVAWTVTGAGASFPQTAIVLTGRG